MPAKFLTPDEIQSQRNRATEFGAKNVEAFYSKMGKGFGRALFFSCMRMWGSGPAITAARLNTNARGAIEKAWQYNDSLAGVLLKRHNFDFMPIFLQTNKLAHVLTERGDYFVDFAELSKELKQ